MSSVDKRLLPTWKIVALHLLGLFFIQMGSGLCLAQFLQDGFWPMPFGIVFVPLGGYLWMLGARARLARGRSSAKQETA